MPPHRSIRRYRTADADAVITIWRAASAHAQPFLSAAFIEQVTADIRDIYLSEAETFVLEDEGHAVGFISLFGDEVGGLFLEPAYHGRGHGRALLDHAVDLKGVVRLEVFARNRSARRFYARYGFVETGRYIHEASGEETLKLSLAPA